MGLCSTFNLAPGKTWMRSRSQWFVCLTCTNMRTGLAWLAFLNSCSICFSTSFSGRLHMPSGQCAVLSDEQKERCWQNKSFMKPRKWKGFYKPWLLLHLAWKAQILIGGDVIIFSFNIFCFTFLSRAGHLSLSVVAKWKIIAARLFHSVHNDDQQDLFSGSCQSSTQLKISVTGWSFPAIDYKNSNTWGENRKKEQSFWNWN